MALRTLHLPPAFWNDHYERCGAHPGVRNVIGQKGSRIIVELDAEALADLRSDADYYSEPTGCPDTPWLRRSARITLETIGAD